MLRFTCFVIAVILIVGLGSIAQSKDFRASVMAGASPELTGFWDQAILVLWDCPKSVNDASVISYHVWRQPGDAATPVADLASNVAQPAYGYAHSCIDDFMARSFSFYQASKNHKLTAKNVEAPGIIMGLPYKYWVSCLYRRNNKSAAKPTYLETQPAYAGQATCLQRPLPSAPGTPWPGAYARLDVITFQWWGSRGADQYSIEVSTSPLFSRESTWVSHVYAPTFADPAFFVQIYTDVLSTAPELAGVVDGDTLYWRVGARNSKDDPGPIPAGPSPLAKGAKNTRYIYNSAENVLSFTVGDDGGGGGDDPPPPPPL